jgi:hypothetical protein
MFGNEPQLHPKGYKKQVRQAIVALWLARVANVSLISVHVPRLLK